MSSPLRGVLQQGMSSLEFSSLMIQILTWLQIYGCLLCRQNTRVWWIWFPLLRITVMLKRSVNRLLSTESYLGAVLTEPMYLWSGSCLKIYIMRPSLFLNLSLSHIWVFCFAVQFVFITTIGLGSFLQIIPLLFWWAILSHNGATEVHSK
jgi:hypothetical protein